MLNRRREARRERGGPQSSALVFSRRPFPFEWAALLLVIAAGAAARFYRLPETPPGLYQDEGYYALDALEVINGARPIYFPANNGREPLFIYILSLSISIFGRSPFAVRLPAAIFGTLTLMAAYMLGSALFNRRIGLLTAAIAAGSFWAIAFSRIGLRAATLPLVATLMLACAAYGWRTRRLWLIAVAGALCGLCFYTYVAARLVPLPFLMGGLFWYIARRSSFPSARWLAAFFAPAVWVAAPLALYALREPDIYLGRVGQVSIFGSDHAWGTLFDNFIATLGMFNWRGDMNARHNLPGRPIFDLWLGAAFLAGGVWSVYRALRQRHLASVMLLAWSATLLLPTLLSDNAPHFLRAIGALPMVFVFPALALDWLWRRAWRWGLNRVVVIGALLASGALNVWTYFGPYAHDPNTALYFQTATTELAATGNAFLGTGWTGGPSASQAQPIANRTLYLDQRLWNSFAQVRFLLPVSDSLRFFGDTVLAPASTVETIVLAWPYTDLRPAKSALPANSVITPREGALYRNDFDASAAPLYYGYEARPLPEPRPAPVAEFEVGSILQSADVLSTSAGTVVRLLWSASAPQPAGVHVFVHLRNGNTIEAQADAPLGSALYPADEWRTEDWVETFHELNAHVRPGWRVFVGLYHYPSGERILVKEGAADAVGIAIP